MNCGTASSAGTAFTYPKPTHCTFRHPAYVN